MSGQPDPICFDLYPTIQTLQFGISKHCIIRACIFFMNVSILNYFRGNIVVMFMFYDILAMLSPIIGILSPTILSRVVLFPVLHLISTSFASYHLQLVSVVLVLFPSFNYVIIFCYDCLYHPLHGVSNASFVANLHQSPLINHKNAVLFH